MKNVEPHELATCVRVLASKLHKRLKQQMKSTDALSITEITTLSNLYHHGALYPSEMADMVKVKAQSMSQIINRLHELHLIERTPSDMDKRKVAISLSQHGRQTVDQTRHERDKWLATAIEKDLSAEEQTLLQQAMNILDKLIEHN